jgi:peptidyl-prolyl cis-trans isomerase C
MLVALALGAAGSSTLAGAEEAAAKAASAAPAADHSVAVVNGSTITQGELDAYSKRRPKTPATAAHGEGGQESLVNELVAQELLVQEAQKRGLDKSPTVMAELEMLRRGLLAREAVQAYLADHPISDADLKKEYDTLVAKMAGKEYKAKHILLETEDAAKQVIAELDKGAKFDDLAKTKSTGPSANEGGDLGWFSPDQMVKPFSDAVAVLKKGSYTEQPVQTQFGWHVILLEDTRDTPIPAFDEVKDQVRSFMAQRDVQKYLGDLRAKAKVEIN